MLKHIFLLFILAFLSLNTAFAADEVWKPVSTEELTSKTPKVESDADAEVIFWEVQVEDKWFPRDGFKTILNHYIRVKIFTDLGRENHSKVDIPYGRNSTLSARISISQIEARTIKPDGTIIPLDEKSIFEREIVKGDGIKIKAKSFVLPGIETGSIVEYRWKEIRDDVFSFYVRLQLAREDPVRMVKYYLKPVSAPRFELAMRIRTFNTTSSLQKEDGGFYSMTFRDVASFREEPRMPPEYDVRPWLLVYYAYEEDDTNISQDKYWENKAERTYEIHDSIFKDKKEIKAAALTAVGDAAEPLEKVRRIFDFCREKIKNINDDALDLSRKERGKIKENKSEADTLKRLQGTGHDINQLFAAMVNAAGLEVRVANVTRRSNPSFTKTLLNDYLIDSEVIAVKIGESWQYFEPASQHLPFGMLDWSKENQTVLISGKGDPIWDTTPVSKPSRSMQKSSMKFKLYENGGIEGEGRIEFTGHLAAVYKENLDDDTAAEREKAVVDFLKGRVGDTAEVSDIKLENIEDRERPLIYSFKLRVPDFAEQTGRRFFLRPNVLTHNTKPLFGTSKRRNDIFFRYAWSEKDDITIEIPGGFSAEVTDPPKNISDSKGLGSYVADIKFDADSRTIHYKRDFAFGQTGELEFNYLNYASLKTLFDSYFESDQHVISLVKE